MSRLIRANLLLFALLIVHTADHAINQPDRDLPATGTVIGIAGFAIAAATTLLAVRRHPLAPATAVYMGAVSVVGIVAIHLLPSWWDVVSDPYYDFDANAGTWILVALPLLAAANLTRVGLTELRGPRAAPA